MEKAHQCINNIVFDKRYVFKFYRLNEMIARLNFFFFKKKK
jgi:hypothetical protein